MMRIKDRTLARVYSFDLQFEGGQRTRFYRELFGFKSKSTREDSEGREKVYENFYPGKLTPLPHLKLGKSVIAIPKVARSELDSFFESSDWGDIDLYSFDGILPAEDRMEAMEEALERIQVPMNDSLRSEIDSLLAIRNRGQLNSEDVQRVRRALEKLDRLTGYDWTDDSMFSQRMEEEVEDLRKFAE